MQTAVHHAAVQGAQERMARSDESCLPMKRPVRLCQTRVRGREI